MATWAKPANGAAFDRQAVQTNAESDPGTVAEGVSARGVAGYTFTAECENGQSFNNAATVFKAWTWDDTVGFWSRVPEADITVGADVLGSRRFAVSFTVASPRGRRIHVWDGTGVTGGNVTTTYTVSLLSGEATFG